jgi:2,6-dihydroxypseudooxynicotine hydrolase
VALAGPYDFGECWDGLPELTRTAFRVRSHSTDDTHARAVGATLDLAGRTASITCPLLVVAGRLDRIIPWQHARRLADETVKSTLLMLERGNHGCMNLAAHHRPYTADWLAGTLAATPTRPAPAGPAPAGPAVQAAPGAALS